MVMKILQLSLFICVLQFVTPVFAQQNPKAVLAMDKAREAFVKSGSISADFEAHIYQKGKETGVQKGTIKMKGAKYRVNTDEADIWFDGKNQWVLPAGTDEVSLSAPSESEMEVLNPSAMFQIYNKGYRCNYVATKVVNGTSVDIIDLIPVKAKHDITKITLNIDQKRSVLTLISIQNKNGNSQKINITNYKSGMNYQDNVFVFNAKQYPKVEVVDVR